VFTVKIIDGKGKITEATARMRYAVYVKQYYGNKVVAMFENITGAQAWADKYWSGDTVVALVRDDDDHVVGYPTTPTANAETLEAVKKMEDS
jgi:hypothetical protein